MNKTECSKNYEHFLFHVEQRKNNDKRLQRLKKSMLKWGFLPEKAVMVLRLGVNKYKVIDGHSRVEIARQLGIPFYFVVVDKKLDDAVADLNDWPLIDHVRRFALRGCDDYNELLTYMESGLSLTAASSLLSGSVAHSGNQGDALREGVWKIKTREMIDVIVNCMKELGDVCPVVKDQRFHSAMSMCLLVPEFEVERMLHKLRTNPRMLVKVATRDQMLEQLEEIYNFKATMPTKLPLGFMANSCTKARNPIFKSMQGKTEAKS